MAAGTTCSGATTANVYSQFWCAITVETAMTTAMKCSRVVSSGTSFFMCVLFYYPVLSVFFSSKNTQQFAHYCVF